MDQRDKDRLLWNLKSLPNELEDLLKDLDEDTLRWRPVPNKWSIKEIVCHLRDMERLAYLARYRRMLAEENPLMPNVDQDRLAARVGAGHRRCRCSNPPACRSSRMSPSGLRPR